MNIINYIDTIKETFEDRKREIGLHFLAWGIFYLVDFAFVIGFTPVVNAKVIITYLSTIVFYITCFYSIVEFYKRYFPEHVLKGIGISLLLVLLFSGINLSWDIFVIKYQNAVERFNISPLNLFLFETWRFSTAGLYAFAYWIYLQRVKEQKVHLETVKQLYSAEVAFLKAQINPHFLFNTLNFVYANVAEKSTRAGNAIMSLTKLLRYSVESTKHESSSLRKEIEAIKEYLNLQNLRFDEKIFAEFTTRGLYSIFGIPPLILLSLVENAFKYGIIDNPEEPIKINLDADKDSLNFRCKNMKRLDFKDKETTSVGLENIKRRLELTYGSNYKLLVKDDEYHYEVILAIFWKK
jgi:two-component system LytT family sensor kinase